MNDADLCYLPATEQVRLLRERQLSAVELMQAHLARIERLNPQVNAIVTLDADGALAQARAADAVQARGEELGLLHGLPLGVKDILPTRGMRTTRGSPIYADWVPDHDALIVERERAAGAIVVGKTNTPEFAAGAQTFNPVFGETRNPYNLAMTSGGSSGGSAAALACGLLALADGSDLGGSLRNPAAFCNVVGFRPSPGRVPVWPAAMGWWGLSVEGPMARTVQDVARFLAAIAGPDARDPLSIEEPGARFLEPLARDLRGVRVAWSRNLGYLPMDPVITRVCDAQRGVFESLGCEVADDQPDLRGASEVFKTLRAWRYAQEHGRHLREHRDQLKDTVIWNTEEGLKLDGPTVAQAEANRTELYHRVREFFTRYDYLVLPCNPVAPFPVEQRTVTRIGEVELETYVDWGAVRHVISVVGNPVISVPCGFTPDGLPVGLQIVGPHHADFAVLQLAHAFEQATRFGERRPPLEPDGGAAAAD